MILLSILVSVVMFIVSSFHFYWAFGGQYGLKSAGPSLENGKNFVPSSLLIFVVACFLLGLSVLAFQLVSPADALVGTVHYIGYLVAFVFIARAIGDFKYVGFFKKIYNSSFATLDTKYFSPLILLLGISYAALAGFGT